MTTWQKGFIWGVVFQSSIGNMFYWYIKPYLMGN